MKHHFIDVYNSLETPVHGIEPRMKFLVFFSFVIAVVFTPPARPLSFLFYAAYLSTALLMARVPIVHILQRVAIVLPFILMVAVFLPFFNSNGWLILWNVFIKSSLCTIAALLLVSSTSFPELLKALERLKMPQVIIMVMSFMYRYTFIISDEAQRMKVAASCRTFGQKICPRTFAAIVGSLFLRSYERGENIYLAMCARGFDGHIETISEQRIGPKDVLILSFSAAYFATILTLSLC